jgi:hypothetical protein
VCWEMFILPIVGVTCKVGNVYCNNFLYIREPPKSWFKNKYPQLIIIYSLCIFFVSWGYFLYVLGVGEDGVGILLSIFIFFCFQFHFTLQWKFIY